MRLIKNFILMTFFFMFSNIVSANICYLSDETHNPLVGTAFCSSTDPEKCRELDFTRNIKITFDLEPGAMQLPTYYGFLNGYKTLRDTLADQPKINISVSGEGTAYYANSNTAEIRFHFRADKIPSDCGKGDVNGNPQANGAACLHGIGENYKGFSGFQYTKGHLKCDIYINTNLTNLRTADYVERTIVHEAGHCLGLHHITGSSNKDEIMYGGNMCGPEFSPQNCKPTAKFKDDLENGYRGFLSLDSGDPFTEDSTIDNLKFKWKVFQNWFDEDSCSSLSGYSTLLTNGSLPTARRTRDGSRVCIPQLQYYSGGFWGWQNTSQALTCERYPCRAKCN